MKTKNAIITRPSTTAPAPSEGARPAYDGIPVAIEHDGIASVVDLFCGAGGLSHGFILEGVPVACGIDIDDACRFPYEENNRAKFVRRDIASISADSLRSAFAPGAWKVLVGCAPCQPFSLYTQARQDTRWQLLGEFSRLIEEVEPDVVSMENVQRLRRFKGGAVLSRFVARLEAKGYFVSEQDVYCPDYGIPQSRTRLVLLASKHGPISLMPPNAQVRSIATVRDAISSLARLQAGQVDQTDPLHAAAGLSPINLRRIDASKPGGTWHDWPTGLRAECHSRKTGDGYVSVYGRMSWDEPSPTITTQFFGFGSGRFGHPEQRRALTLREGAILQSFPPDYKFIPDGGEPIFTVLGRLIGNAVPVELARAIARTVMNHLEDLGSGKVKSRTPEMAWSDSGPCRRA